MEPVGWIVGLALLFGGYELINKEVPSESVEEVTQEQTVVSDEPVFERGRYFNTSDGYYISNLTPEPIKPDGCDRPVLTADLSTPRTDEGEIQVTKVDNVCGDK